MIVRRERAHPGAQLSFTDHDGHRFQAILTDQTGPVAELERDHRGRARVEDHIRNDKDTGMRNLPFRYLRSQPGLAADRRLAHDLIVWTQRLLLTGELAKAEPKRLRYRLLHVAARLAFHARTATLHLPAAWPWAEPTRRRVHAPGRASRASLTPPRPAPTTTTEHLGPPGPRSVPANRRQDHRNSDSRPAMASTGPADVHHQPVTNPATRNTHPKPARASHEPRAGYRGRYACRP